MNIKKIILAIAMVLILGGVLFLSMNTGDTQAGPGEIAPSQAVGTSELKHASEVPQSELEYSGR